MIPKKIIYSGRATIVFWCDGTKTVVKREKGAKDDKYMAVCSAMAIKTCGSNSHLKKIIKDAENAKEIPKTPKIPMLSESGYNSIKNLPHSATFGENDYGFLTGLWDYD